MLSESDKKRIDDFVIKAYDFYFFIKDNTELFVDSFEKINNNSKNMDDVELHSKLFNLWQDFNEKLLKETTEADGNFRWYYNALSREEDEARRKKD